ncbi:beta-phosphoglucomutase [Oceanobacillus halophilus]|uniref:Beta-phosphoglucomutase n=1 Tax=Oceanobacillus halophilus TaxID=930130 RepID=A0A495A103_9BACI|nr:beta-phosphoglucomutase [Oceanobacillus halophilus]RKQ32512.1 beta-phosphoglucomutase [Oceanobacillus halophilus]
MKYPKAFLFDLDGVITDTAEFHYLAWKQLAKELGVTFDREFNEQLKGISRMDSLEKILALNPSLKDLPVEEKERLATKKNDHYKDLIQKLTPQDILPGIKDLLKDLQNQQIKIALGSASKNAPMVLERLELTHYFDYLVDAAKVSKGKPHPETFTTAADYFNIDYKDCVGVEDAESGVQALNDAGMFSVGVGNELTEADYLVEKTADLKLENILEQYSKWSS